MSLPIGVFDSGLGGLTVLRALRDRFPEQAFVYLGDTARLPYGNKSPATLKRFVEQNIRWMDRWGVKAVVVACNSASTVLDTIVNAPFPVFDVIGPGAEAGVAATKSGVIAVMATRATVNSNAYLHAIRKLSPSVS
ncbi:MAG: aspartate/glutamate racemase family protein, partial [Bdellovibrionales bacterium]|nr:aspartate/glutamate racemase family protein [Bdellovibrionales bacterium]